MAYDLEAVRSLSIPNYTQTHKRTDAQFVDRAMLLAAYQGWNSRVLGHPKMHPSDMALRDLTLSQPDRTRTVFTVSSKQRVFERQRGSSSRREPEKALIITHDHLFYHVGAGTVLLVALTVSTALVRSDCSSPV